MAGGFDHLGALRRELRGSQRALEIHFNELDDLRKEDFLLAKVRRLGARARMARVVEAAEPTTVRR